MISTHVKNVVVSLMAAGCFSACAALPSTPQHAQPGPESSPGLMKREKVPAVSAAAPSRELDLADPTGGRKKLLDLYWEEHREMEEMLSTMRGKDQRIAALEASNAEFAASLAGLRKEIQKAKETLDTAQREMKEKDELLLGAALKQAEAEKELLQLRIAIRKDKASSRSNAGPGPAPAKEEPKKGAEEHKKEEEPKGGHH